MPIYEYRCQACGHYLDALEKISDKPQSVCPACNKATLKRLISAPSFRLKGSGWYETDFKSDKDKQRNLVDSGGDAGNKAKSESGDKSKESAKPEAKPATSSDSKQPATDTKAKSKSAGTGSEAA
jgi:putative FmdB family regulatory protein